MGTEQPTADQILASAAQFLIDGGEEDAASALLSCSMQAYWWSTEYMGESRPMPDRVDITLRAPRAAYDLLTTDNHPVGQAVSRAFNALLGYPFHFGNYDVRAEFVTIDSVWRKELLDIARGKGVHNQGLPINDTILKTWNNLRFRSESEVRVARALEGKGVLFLPNTMAGLTTPEGRRNREADFIIIDRGKIGILEVDGEPFHPPARTVQDHERDRLFRGYGIRLIEHYDATRCYQDAGSVVDEFLTLLAGS